MPNRNTHLRTSARVVNGASQFSRLFASGEERTRAFSANNHHNGQQRVYAACRSYVTVTHIMQHRAHIT